MPWRFKIQRYLTAEIAENAEKHDNENRSENLRKSLNRAEINYTQNQLFGAAMEVHKSHKTLALVCWNLLMKPA